MKIKQALVVALIYAGWMTPVVAGPSDLLVTNFGGSTLGFEFLNTGAVSALQFDVKFQEPVQAGALNLSKCVSALPSSHTGGCSVLKTGVLRVLVYGNANELLTSGGIGLVSANYDFGQVSIENLLVFGADASTLTAEPMQDARGLTDMPEDLTRLMRRREK